MITETATVTRVEPHEIWVKTRSRSVCGSCKARQGCGQEVLQRLGQSWSEMPIRQPEVPIPGLSVGDSVEIGIDERAVLTASLVSYGAPLVGLLVGILMMSSQNFAALSLGGGVLGLLAGGRAATCWARSQGASSTYQPQLLRQLASGAVVESAVEVR